MFSEEHTKFITHNPAPSSGEPRPSFQQLLHQWGGGRGGDGGRAGAMVGGVEWEGLPRQQRLLIAHDDGLVRLRHEQQQVHLDTYSYK